MIIDLHALPDAAAFDVIVVGSGAAGMASAVFAAIAGHSVLLLERTDRLGGTSALSAATTWVPNTRHAATVAPPGSPDADSVEKARHFLDGAVGNRSATRLRDAFLASAPVAIATLEAQTDVQFRPYATHPDYEQDHDGATMRGRALEPVPFDGRALGADINLLRPPIPEFTLFGGMMIDRTDIGHLLNLGKSIASFRHAAGILGHYALDRLRRRRGTRLVMGNALIGRMLLAAQKRGVSIALHAEVQEFIAGERGVEGVVIGLPGGSRRIMARCGVVLAAGGFNRHATRRAEFLHQPTPPHSPSAPGHTGLMQDLALKLGARFAPDHLDTAFWAPVSVRRRADGTTAVFPHFVLDRSKPGTVCVNQAGRRFVNESTSYHLFSRAMFEANQTSPCIPCFIVTDAVGLKRYGLGMVRMGSRTLQPFLADGYLVQGATLAALAAKLNLPPGALEQTVAAMNDYARTGIDPEFQRGRTAYHRANGDAARGGPNPTLGPIATPPFYAVRLTPGDIGASTGLMIDADAQVLGAGDRPIGGLYACGNEAASIMGGVYPAPGITIGPAITFAFRAIAHATGHKA